MLHKPIASKQADQEFYSVTLLNTGSEPSMSHQQAVQAASEPSTSHKRAARCGVRLLGRTN